MFDVLITSYVFTGKKNRHKAAKPKKRGAKICASREKKKKGSRKILMQPCQSPGAVAEGELGRKKRTGAESAARHRGGGYKKVFNKKRGLRMIGGVGRIGGKRLYSC